jgi:hypothetical protein
MWGCRSVGCGGGGEGRGEGQGGWRGAPCSVCCAQPPAARRVTGLPARAGTHATASSGAAPRPPPPLPGLVAPGGRRVLTCGRLGSCRAAAPLLRAARQVRPGGAGVQDGVLLAQRGRVGLALQNRLLLHRSQLPQPRLGRHIDLQVSVCRIVPGRAATAGPRLALATLLLPAAARSRARAVALLAAALLVVRGGGGGSPLLLLRLLRLPLPPSTHACSVLHEQQGVVARGLLGTRAGGRCIVEGQLEGGQRVRRVPRAALHQRTTRAARSSGSSSSDRSLMS